MNIEIFLFFLSLPILCIVYSNWLLGQKLICPHKNRSEIKTVIKEVVIIAPIKEEIIFRFPLIGIVYFWGEGAVFYILTSLSIFIFALCHKVNYNWGFVWVFPLYIIGSIGFTYTAIEAGIVWAILMHAQANAIFLLYSLLKEYQQKKEIYLPPS